MSMIIPISMRYRGKQYFFPKRYRGREVPDTLGITIWRSTCPEYYSSKTGRSVAVPSTTITKRPSARRKRS